ncbi:SDR family NAD(P)-dependent oxidoreductase [Glaciimonas sp. GG7]
MGVGKDGLKLFNKTGVGAVASVLNGNADGMDAMITLNITALTRLTYAVAPVFVSKGTGRIINIGL